MSIMKSLFAVVVLLGTTITPAFAHIQLKYPPPLLSKFHPSFSYDRVDTNMVAPLDAEKGFPCKGYIDAPNVDMSPVATVAAGSALDWYTDGSANHNGGSCQIVLSYDKGKTWQVIMSHIGGCMKDAGMAGYKGGTWGEQVVIPDKAPAGDALFGWIWFNETGNKEMYMNCAVITVTGGGSGLTPAADYPTPFVANSGDGQNTCTTTAGTDTVFPNPGKNVVYGGKYAGQKPELGTGVVGTNCVAKGATEAGGAASGQPDTASGGSTPANSPAAGDSGGSAASGTTVATVANGGGPTAATTVPSTALTPPAGGLATSPATGASGASGVSTASSTPSSTELQSAPTGTNPGGGSNKLQQEGLNPASSSSATSTTIPSSASTPSGAAATNAATAPGVALGAGAGTATSPGGTTPTKVCKRKVKKRDLPPIPQLSEEEGEEYEAILVKADRQYHSHEDVKRFGSGPIQKRYIKKKALVERAKRAWLEAEW